MTNFAITSNLILLLGTKFKTNEFTSGRMADVMGSLYIIKSLDWFNSNNNNKLNDLVKYAKYEEYNKIQKNMIDISDNYPIFGIKQLLQFINSETFMNKNFKISDKMIKKASDSITKNIEIRDILSENIYMNNRLILMNSRLESILNYQYSKERNGKLELLIDEITKVDEFQNDEKIKNNNL